jgi:hypothetical protein
MGKGPDTRSKLTQRPRTRSFHVTIDQIAVGGLMASERSCYNRRHELWILAMQLRRHSPRVTFIPAHPGNESDADRCAAALKPVNVARKEKVWRDLRRWTLLILIRS